MTEKYIYIYEMPYKVRQRLVDVLNVNEVWKDLAGIYLNYGQVMVHFIYLSEIRSKNLNSLFRLTLRN